VKREPLALAGVAVAIGVVNAGHARVFGGIVEEAGGFGYDHGQSGAGSAPASVVVVSPWTTTKSGRR